MTFDLDTPAVNIVRASLSTLYGENGPDWDAFAATLSDDIIFLENGTLPFGGEYVGKEIVIRAVTLIYSMFDEFMTRTQNLFQADDPNVVGLYVSCFGKAKSSGQLFGTSIMERWRISDGKICEIKAFYFDPQRVRSAFDS